MMNLTNWRARTPVAIPFTFLLFAASLTLPAHAETQNHKAHVHGAAKLILALETPTDGSIDLDSAADSFLGFEHDAKTPKEKTAKDQAFQKLRDQAANVVRFDPSLGCTVSATKVEMEKETPSTEEAKDKHHGQHADINASFSVKCKKPVSGSKVEVGLIALFPKLKSVSFQILSSSTQVQSDVKNEHDSILVP